MKLVERMARAICTAGGNDPGRFWGENAEEEWKLYVDEARGALVAMREPSQELMDAAIPALEQVNALVAFANAHGCTLVWTDGKPPLWHAWNAMIDTALAE